MSVRILRVSPSEADAYNTVSQALAAAGDGEALITIAPGNYPESLHLRSAVTLCAEQQPGSVTLSPPQGSAVVGYGGMVRMWGVSLTGEDETAPVVDVRSGQVRLESCSVSGAAWAAAVARETGLLAVRDCQVANRHGAGVVVTSGSDNTVERTGFTGIASSAVVVAENGRLTVSDCVLEGSGGNGICINGHGTGSVRRTEISRSGRPAIAVEEQGSAQLSELTVTGSTALDAYIASSGAVTLTDSRFSGSAGPSVLICDAAQPLLRGCVIGAAGVGLRITGEARPRVEGCEISAETGVLVEDSGRPVFEGLRVRGSAGSPAASPDSSGAEADRLPGPTCECGLRVTGPSLVVLRDGEVTAEGIGVELSQGCEAHLTDLRVRSSNGPGIIVSDGATATVDSAALQGCGVVVGPGSALTLRGSDVADAPGDGIRVLAEGVVTATGCRIRGAQGRPVHSEPEAVADLVDCVLTDTMDAGARSPADEGGHADDEPNTAHDEPSTARDTVPTEEPAASPGPGPVGSPVSGLPETGTGAGDRAGEEAVGPYRARRSGRERLWSFHRLDTMVGQDDVRDALRRRLSDLMFLPADKPVAGAANVVLAGDRGSGRSAVTAVYAGCLAEIGFLSHGAVQTAELSRFPADWPEQVGAWAASLLDAARGGVLMLDLDEAFAGRPPEERSAVLDALAECADADGEIVLVLSGTPEPVKRLLRERDDVARHFAEYLELTPYLPEQTAELVRRGLAARGLGLDKEAFDVLAVVLADHVPPDGANGAHRLAERIAQIALSRTVSVTDLMGDTPRPHERSADSGARG